MHLECIQRFAQLVDSRVNASLALCDRGKENLELDQIVDVSVPQVVQQTVEQTLVDLASEKVALSEDALKFVSEPDVIGVMRPKTGGDPAEEAALFQAHRGQDCLCVRGIVKNIHDIMDTSQQRFSEHAEELVAELPV